MRVRAPGSTRVHGVGYRLGWRRGSGAVVVMKNQRFLARLRFAWEGLKFAVRAERSMRVQLIALVGVAGALTILRPEPLWWGLVALASAWVLTAEVFNTAVEHLADHLHPEVHPGIRILKGCAAGAVLIAVLGAIGVGVALVLHLWLTAK
jgi:undecaprenol kinase